MNPLHPSLLLSYTFLQFFTKSNDTDSVRSLPFAFIVFLCVNFLFFPKAFDIIFSNILVYIYLQVISTNTTFHMWATQDIMFNLTYFIPIYNMSISIPWSFKDHEKSHAEFVPSIIFSRKKNRHILKKKFILTLVKTVRKTLSWQLQ